MGTVGASPTRTASALSTNDVHEECRDQRLIHSYENIHPINPVSQRWRLDGSLGVLLEEVKRLGLEKNTIVCLASDNGFTSEGWWGVGTKHFWDDVPLFRAKGPWNRGKHINTNGGVIVPFIAWGPGRVVSGKTDRAISFHDFMATASELAGAKLPGPVDSVSFVPLLEGRDKDQPVHPPILWSGPTCIYGAMHIYGKLPTICAHWPLCEQAMCEYRKGWTL